MAWCAQEMMNAGMETMSTTGEWAMAELAMRPDLIKRAQDELDAVIRTPRIVEEADLPDLPFLTAVVKEAFRLHPPGVFLIPKESLEDTELQGYHIPKGTMVMVNLTGIHRDSAVYENPEKFDPDRFVARQEVNHMSGTDFFELMPFGAGRRMCPGNRMGDTMVRLMLANLLYLFDWSLPAGQSEVDMREHFGLAVILETSLKMVATPRIHLGSSNTIAPS